MSFCYKETFLHQSTTKRNFAVFPETSNQFVSKKMGGKPKVKGAKKKKHISKHILEAKKAQSESIGGNAEGVPQLPDGEQLKKRKQKKNRNVKSPSEASEYLAGWKDHKNGEASTWKFNKNTQSWLIRHMYEIDKVPKREFAIMLEYLEGLKGATVKSRIRSESNRRALRYKRHEKSKEANVENDENKDRDEKQDESTDSKEQNDENKKGEKKEKDDEDVVVEQARWLKLSDLDKRKEYKRALKIIGLMKEK